MVGPGGLAVIYPIAGSDQRFTGIAIGYQRPFAQLLAPLVVFADRRPGLRTAVGVLELLGPVKVDLHGSLLWEYQTL